jgi:hypothetical protein
VAQRLYAHLSRGAAVIRNDRGSARKYLTDPLAAPLASEHGNAARFCSCRIVRLFYGCWSVMCIPLADRLNLSPPVCECSLITTPFSFLR